MKPQIGMKISKNSGTTTQLWIQGVMLNPADILSLRLEIAW